MLDKPPLIQHDIMGRARLPVLAQHEDSQNKDAALEARFLVN
jgi:hypothetical protein